jgi:signal transduction histidine kinase
VGEVGLRASRDETAYRAIIGSMLEEADRLASLVDRLLALSRAEGRHTTLSRSSFDLRLLVNEVASDLSVLAEEKRQAIGVDGAMGVEVLADRDVLRQALINLVDNAVKFTPAGGQIQLRVSQIGRDAVVDVIDTGPGVPADARDRVFERFYRSGTSAGAPGAGLGLSIAKGAVEANGGRLTLEPSASGSTFRITIPRHEQRRRRRAG